ncbi:hypothetical protein PG984_010505 [Apiospora sp. TS-2023a]
MVVANHFRENQNTLSNFYDFLMAEHATMTVSTQDPRDMIYAPLNMLRSSQPDLNLKSFDTHLSIDYMSSTLDVYTRAAIDIRHVCLSFAKRIPKRGSQWPSWVPDWKSNQVQLLLNHHKSSFCSSSVPPTAVSLSLGLYSPGTLFVGSHVDVIAETACYLPRRRHCDHYNVDGANILIFDEWFEFVKERVRKSKRRGGRDLDALIQFVETVQAKGCNTIWTPSASNDLSTSVERAREFIDFLEDEDAEPTPELRLFYAACYPAHGRRLGITRSGRFGLFPEKARRMDIVSIMDGYRVPIILRKKGESFISIGESYVNGLMMGEGELQSDFKRTYLGIM